MLMPSDNVLTFVLVAIVERCSSRHVREPLGLGYRLAAAKQTCTGHRQKRTEVVRLAIFDTDSMVMAGGYNTRHAITIFHLGLASSNPVSTIQETPFQTFNPYL
jgi:hypothetical protein